FSVRSGFPFLKINCGALPADLLNRELFGSAGDSTCRAKEGKPELCRQGTLFLDGIFEMAMSVQANLVAVLQDGCLRNWNKAAIPLDGRILASCESFIVHHASARKIREDLYFQLSAFTIHVPPLRERRDEIPILFSHFAHQLSKRYGLPRRMISPAIQQAC